MPCRTFYLTVVVNIRMSDGVGSMWVIDGFILSKTGKNSIPHQNLPTD